MMQSKYPEARHWSEHILVKVFTIGAIVLVLMIPSVMINELVRERSARRTDVTSEVSSKWGQLQTLAGPYISIPYYEEVRIQGLAPEWKEHMLHYYPKSLKVTGELKPVERKRSIFRVMLYESDLLLTGDFEAPDLPLLQIDPKNVRWEKARLHMGITDLTGIGEQVNLRINDTLIKMNAALPAAIQFPNGLMAPLPNDLAPTGFPFEIKLKLKGSRAFYVSPVANATQVSLKSTWPSPKFEGQFLPDTSSVSSNGFEAHWTVLDINRQMSQEWTDHTPQSISTAPAQLHAGRYTTDVTMGGSRSLLGVELLDPVDHYTKNQRTVKYAFLLITLTFVIYFFSEVLKQQRVHPLQYGLVGAALVIFFLLLLSLSEHIGFDIAYIVSSLATILLITLYSRTIFSNKNIAGLVGILLTVQFGLIYIILQLEDFALLAGSIALFVIIALIMYLTRKVKW